MVRFDADDDRTAWRAERRVEQVPGRRPRADARQRRGVDAGGQAGERIDGNLPRLDEPEQGDAALVAEEAGHELVRRVGEQ